MKLGLGEVVYKFGRKKIIWGENNIVCSNVVIYDLDFLKFLLCLGKYKLKFILVNIFVFLFILIICFIFLFNFIDYFLFYIFVCVYKVICYGLSIWN